MNMIISKPTQKVVYSLHMQEKASRTKYLNQQLRSLKPMLSPK